ncbi:MAG: OprO/OprP family phosphate-selective porin [Candidatus Eiseniibacteriota bacterium]
MLSLLASLFLVIPGISLAQSPEASSTEGTSAVGGPAVLDTTLAAGEADAQLPVKRGLAKYNEFDLGFTTFRFGYGFLVDFTTFAQDDEAKAQVPAESDIGLRDFRLMLKGKFNTKRDITWTFGYMYDLGDDDWHFRQTGLMIGVPEINSHFFVGRTKEGYSQYKHMTGYDLWTVERSPFLDAFIPILGDGVKWISGTRNRRLLWQLGWFNDFLTENEKFANWDNQVVARVTALPVLSKDGRKLLHVSVMGRDAEPDQGSFQARSRPENYLAPYFVDTGKFAADHGQTLGFEAYYRSGSVLVGGEYGWQMMDAPASGDPTFHGGNISVDWFITGETRSYNNVSAYFNAVSPKRTVFEGGPGAVEGSLNFSYIDLDAGTLRGGKFWRISPAVKWHLMDYLRVELAYGYGVLDRFDLKGTTQFFQGRILTAL